MVTLAKALYVSDHNFWGKDKFIFDKVDVIDVGKDIGEGMPVKFMMSGIRGFQTQEPQPPGWYGGVAVWIGKFIESEERFNQEVVVLYKKDEFGKLNASLKGGMHLINEDQVKQCEELLLNMENAHKIAKEQNVK